MTAEELRRAVERQRGAVAGGVLQDRRREGVVDEHGHGAGCRDDRRDVDLREGGVLRRLEQHEPRVAPDRSGDRLLVRPRDVETEEPAGEQVIGAAVEWP